VTIQTKALAAADTYGQQAEAWSDVKADVPALVEAMDAAEPWRADRSQPEATWRVTMRYRSDVTSAKRLVWGSQYLYPTAVQPDPRKRSVIVLCKERP